MDAAAEASSNELGGVNVGDLVPREVLENPGVYAVAGLAVLVYQHRSNIVGWFRKLIGRGR